MDSEEGSTLDVPPSNIALNGVVITPSGRMVCADTGADLNAGYAHYLRMEYTRVFGYMPEGYPPDVTVQFISTPADWDESVSIHYFTAVCSDRFMQVSICGTFDLTMFVVWMTSALQGHPKTPTITKHLH